jgi:hypothetical protein
MSNDQIGLVMSALRFLHRVSHFLVHQFLQRACSRHSSSRVDMNVTPIHRLSDIQHLSKVPLPD